MVTAKASNLLSRLPKSIHTLPTSMTVNSKNTVFLIDLTFMNVSPHLLCCVWIISVVDTSSCLNWPVHVTVSYYTFPHFIFENQSNFVTDTYLLINNLPFHNTSTKLNANSVRFLKMVILIYIKLHVINLNTYYTLNRVVEGYFVRSFHVMGDGSALATIPF
jgi:hypothetical protein